MPEDLRRSQEGITRKNSKPLLHDKSRVFIGLWYRCSKDIDAAKVSFQQQQQQQQQLSQHQQTIPPREEIPQLEVCKLNSQLNKNLITFDAGKTKNFFSNWCSLISDPEILETISGLPIEVSNSPKGGHKGSRQQ